MVDFNKIIVPKVYPSKSEGILPPINKFLDHSIRQVYPDKVAGKTLRQVPESSLLQKVLNRSYYVVLSIFSLGLLPLLSKSFYEAMKLTWDHKVVLIPSRRGTTPIVRGAESLERGEPLTTSVDPAVAHFLQRWEEHFSSAASVAAVAVAHEAIVEAADHLLAREQLRPHLEIPVEDELLGEDYGAPSSRGDSILSLSPSPADTSRVPLDAAAPPLGTGSTEKTPKPHLEIPEVDEHVGALSSRGDSSLTPSPLSAEAPRAPVIGPLDVPLRQEEEVIPIGLAGAASIVVALGALSEAMTAAVEAPLPPLDPGLARRADEVRESHQRLEVLFAELYGINSALAEATALAERAAAEAVAERGAELDALEGRFGAAATGGPLAAAREDEGLVGRLREQEDPEIRAAEERLAGAREALTRFEQEEAAARSTAEARERLLAAMREEAEAAARTFAGREEGLRAELTALEGEAARLAQEERSAAIGAIMLADTVALREASALELASLETQREADTEALARAEEALALANQRVEERQALAAASAREADARLAVARAVGQMTHMVEGLEEVARSGQESLLAPVASVEGLAGREAVQGGEVEAPLVPIPARVDAAAAAAGVQGATAAAAAGEVVAAGGGGAAGGAGRVGQARAGRKPGGGGAGRTWGSLALEALNGAKRFVNSFDRRNKVLREFKEKKMKLSHETEDLLWGLCYKAGAVAVTMDSFTAEGIDKAIGDTLARREEIASAGKSVVQGTIAAATGLLGLAAKALFGGSDEDPSEDAYRGLGEAYRLEGRELLEGFFRDVPPAASKGWLAWLAGNTYPDHVSNLRDSLDRIFQRYMPDLRTKREGWTDEDVMRAGKVLFTILAALKMVRLTGDKKAEVLKTASKKDVAEQQRLLDGCSVRSTYGSYPINLGSSEHPEIIDVVSLAAEIAGSADACRIVAEASFMERELSFELTDGVSPYWTAPPTPAESHAAMLGGAIDAASKAHALLGVYMGAGKKDDED